MTTRLPKLHITTPAATQPRGRGFYQLEEEELYLPVEYPGERGHFYSYIESNSVCLQFDHNGRLIFIEITIPRRRWEVKENLVPPESAEWADIRFLDFRDTIPDPVINCDRERQTVLLRFSQDSSTDNYYLAENIIAQISAGNNLIAVWAFDIRNDLAGREIAGWRKRIHRKQPAVPRPVSTLNM